MKDVEGYLRYVMPGFIFLLCMVIPILIIDPERLFLLNGNPVQTIGYITGFIVTSGAIGFLISTIYWLCLQYWDWQDLKRMLAQLESKGKLKIVDTSGTPVDSSKNQTAWTVFNTYWYLRELDKALDAKADRLARLTHSLGTALAAGIISCVLWLLILIKLELEVSCYSCIGLVLFWSILFVTLGINYSGTLKRFRLFINSIFCQWVTKEFDRNCRSEPVVIVIGI